MKKQTTTAVIRVTHKHIAKGTPHAGRACPVFLALNEQLKLVGDNKWNAQHSFLDDAGKLKTPARVGSFIERFDSADTREKCKPFSFRLFYNGWATPKVK